MFGVENQWAVQMMIHQWCSDACRHRWLAIVGHHSLIGVVDSSPLAGRHRQLVTTRWSASLTRLRSLVGIIDSPMSPVSQVSTLL
ncbi:hypothetical protein U1Q18_011962 [Sarracenia purpurea var. burkii]